MTKKVLYKIPLLTSVLCRLNRDISEVGLQQALSLFAERTHTKIRVIMDDTTRDVLAKERVVIVANHPGDSDPLPLLASLPPRRDLRLIVTDDIAGVSDELDAYFIPVHMRPHKNDETTPWRLHAYLAHEIGEKKDWTSESAHQYNISQIQKASDFVSAGGSVVIYPFQHLADNLWFPGVGFLVAGIKTKNPVYVVNTCVSGTTYHDYLRLIPFVGRFMEPFTVCFSRPVKVNTLCGKSGKEVSEAIRRMYTAWVKKEGLPA